MILDMRIFLGEKTDYSVFVNRFRSEAEIKGENRQKTLRNKPQSLCHYFNYREASTTGPATVDEPEVLGSVVEAAALALLSAADVSGLLLSKGVAGITIGAVVTGFVGDCAGTAPKVL
jgi:hypothetical protein